MGNTKVVKHLHFRGEGEEKEKKKSAHRRTGDDDDGSGDGTQDFVRSNFPMVRLIFQSNRGVSAARNTGISHSKGDWILS